MKHLESIAVLAVFILTILFIVSITRMAFPPKGHNECVAWVNLECVEIKFYPDK
jgi:hypothetical protein